MEEEKKKLRIVVWRVLETLEKHVQVNTIWYESKGISIRKSYEEKKRKQEGNKKKKKKQDDILMTATPCKKKKIGVYCVLL